MFRVVNTLLAYRTVIMGNKKCRDRAALMIESMEVQYEYIKETGNIAEKGQSLMVFCKLRKSSIS